MWNRAICFVCRERRHIGSERSTQIRDNEESMHLPTTLGTSGKRTRDESCEEKEELIKTKEESKKLQLNRKLTEGTYYQETIRRRF